jgi:hypothetical protein
MKHHNSLFRHHAALQHRFEVIKAKRTDAQRAARLKELAVDLARLQSVLFDAIDAARSGSDRTAA